MNNIRSEAKSIRELLSKRYIVQYYQREYSWKTKQIQELIDDLTTAFFLNYSKDHTQRDVRYYDEYFLGPVILTNEGAIIDGQQRLSTITLLLIFLNHLQNKSDNQVNITSLIFSEQYGEKTFTINVTEREKCLSELYKNDYYETTDNDNESVINLSERYIDIKNYFPEEIEKELLPIFIEWLKERIIFVEITTQTEQEAHKVFVTMNDRGLRLTPVEMLKGYLLSEISHNESRNKANDSWKKNILRLKESETDGDMNFIKTWLRAQFAETQRERKKGSKNLDYEIIGEIPHKWLRENSLNIGLQKSIDFENFIDKNFRLYSDIYIRLLNYSNKFTQGFEHVYYNAHRGFTLQNQLILSAIAPHDNQDIINKKIKIVSRFIDQYITRRIFNYKSMNYSTILYAVFKITLRIRRQSTNNLINILKTYLYDMEYSLDNIDHFKLNQFTKKYIFHNLARITNYIENRTGLNTHFDDYINRDQKNSFDIEHVLPNVYSSQMKEWFESEEEFYESRQYFGALILLSRDKNRSLQSMPFSEKINKYDSENLLARTFNNNCYKNNPSFLRFINEKKLDFKPYSKFGKIEITHRQKLYKQICEIIWNPELLDI